MHGTCPASLARHFAALLCCYAYMRYAHIYYSDNEVILCCLVRIKCRRIYIALVKISCPSPALILMSCPTYVYMAYGHICPCLCSDDLALTFVEMPGPHLCRNAWPFCRNDQLLIYIRPCSPYKSGCARAIVYRFTTSSRKTGWLYKYELKVFYLELLMATSNNLEPSLDFVHGPFGAKHSLRSLFLYPGFARKYTTSTMFHRSSPRSHHAVRMMSLAGCPYFYDL